jgi:mono/diheme cytochrome c family protein
MRRFVVCVLCVAAPTLLTGCGGKSESPSTTQTSASQTPATQAPAAATPPASTPAPSAAATTSKFDAGPRAGESSMDGGLAAKGERLFQAKGCAVCHGFGKKITCPDLVGVSMRRTATWMENQILHPEVMVKEDPITMDLKKSYALPMTNQNVKPEEARALIEFLKRKDHQAGVIK